MGKRIDEAITKLTNTGAQLVTVQVEWEGTDIRFYIFWEHREDVLAGMGHTYTQALEMLYNRWYEKYGEEDS